MPDFEALILSVNQNIERLEEELGDTQGSLDGITSKLDKLPEKYIPRDEAEIKAERVKKVLVGFIVCMVLLASLFGTILYLNHSVTCGVRGILVSAENASERNPLPDTLSEQDRARIIDQREQARQFYNNSLDRLNIIWPCSGERP